MKRYIFLLLLSLPLVWSCKDKDEIAPQEQDVMPICMHFQVVDAEGNDLLNPENPKAYSANDIKITCTNLKGDGMETFYVGAYSVQPVTRALLYDVLSVQTYPLNNSDQYAIEIAGYDPLRQWPKIEVHIDWPDGSQDYVEVHHTFRSGQRQPRYTTTVYLNGTEVPSPFTIVK